MNPKIETMQRANKAHRVSEATWARIIELRRKLNRWPNSPRLRAEYNVALDAYNAAETERSAAVVELQQIPFGS